MSKPENAFRTAMIGGFDRRDVLLYVGKMMREHRSAEDALQQQMDKLEEECERLRLQSGEFKKAEEAGRRAETLAEELSRQEERAAALAEELALLRESERKACQYAEAVEAEAKQTAEAMAAELRARTAQLEAQYAAYAADVERVAAESLREWEALGAKIREVSSLSASVPLPIAWPEAIAAIRNEGEISAGNIATLLADEPAFSDEKTTQTEGACSQFASECPSAQETSGPVHGDENLPPCQVAERSSVFPEADVCGETVFRDEKGASVQDVKHEQSEGGNALPPEGFAQPGKAFDDDAPIEKWPEYVE